MQLLLLFQNNFVGVCPGPRFNEGETSPSAISFEGSSKKLFSVKTVSTWVILSEVFPQVQLLDFLELSHNGILKCQGSTQWNPINSKSQTTQRCTFLGNIPFSLWPKSATEDKTCDSRLDLPIVSEHSVRSLCPPLDANTRFAGLHVSK